MIRFFRFFRSINKIATNFTIKNIVRSEINKLGKDADLNHIDVSGVTDMSSLFKESNFQGNISRWDVSNVTNMYNTFSYTNYGGDLSHWDVSNVENLESSFINHGFTSHKSIYTIAPIIMSRPWWYKLLYLFGTPRLLWDSLDFKWIDLEKKIIYRDKLVKTLLRGYNTKFDGYLPIVNGLEYFPELELIKKNGNTILDTIS